jgi:endonuclease/exonuclease/phosphatase (EEP) superfamily protein YafD
MRRDTVWVRVLERLGATSLVVTTLALFATQFWVFELFTHFRVQIVACQLLLLAAFLLLRKTRWAVVLLAGIGMNAVAIWPYLAPAGSYAAETTMLRIGVANVERRNTQGDGLIAAMGDAAPEVLAIVEYDAAWAKRLAPLLAGYPHRVELPQDNNFGIALFSRTPILEWTALDLEGSPAIDARIEHGDQLVDVIVVHLMPPISARMAARREHQLTELAEHVATMTAPVIVIGDFNLSPYSPYFKRFLTQSTLHDALARHGLKYTWPASVPLLGIPIDHCLTSSHWQAVNYRRLPAYGSDHYAIVVDLASGIRS